jgi:large subunit ribosomal protein L3
MKQIYGMKMGMTRIFNDAGMNIPVTALQIPEQIVLQVKTKDNDGYDAIQVGFCEQKPQRLSRALIGHVAKAKRGTFKHIRELRFDKTFNGQKSEQTISSFEVGAEVAWAELFATGSFVDISGISIGKGFAGVMKRHHMKGQPMTRGTHEMRRHGGSIGNRKFPGRVFKNKRMPGHMGVDLVSQQNLEVVAVRPEDRVILVKGSIPGAKNQVVLVKSAIK